MEEVAHELRREESPLPGVGAVLYWRSIRPAEPARARVAIVHGYGDHGGRYAHVMEWLARRGVACAAVDLRGQGAASGRRGHVRRWVDYLSDLETFLDHFNATGDNFAPLFVLGHSHGGLIVADAGVSGLLARYGTRGVILSAPFFASLLPGGRKNAWLAAVLNPVAPWMQFPTGLRPEMMSREPAMQLDHREDTLCSRVATPRWYVGHRAAQSRVMRNARRFTLPLLTLIAGDDPIADGGAIRAFVRDCGSSDKTTCVYPDSRHEILRERIRERAMNDVLGWIASRLPGGSDGSLSRPADGERNAATAGDDVARRGG